MKSERNKKERQAGKATRASARQSAVPARAPARRTATPQAPFTRNLMLEQLEPRLLLSADGLGIAPELALPVEQPVAAALSAPAQSTETGVAGIKSSRELVFIDPRIPDAQQLLAALMGDSDASRRFEIITLDTQRDGIVQVTAALRSRMQLDAVHFITHGSDGAIQLGGTLLDAKALAANQDLVSAWGGALKDHADLLFYGCDLALTARGRALVDWIADLTGADVAASTDKTGSTAQGGNWELEYRVGTIDITALVALRGQGEWNHLLATYVVSNTNDTGAGSFRQAVIDANANAGADTIAFSLLTSDTNYSGGTGVWTISLGSALPNISDSVLIDGWSQTGWVDRPLIELNGAGTSPNTDGLVFTAGDSEVRGLIINRFGVGGGAGNGGSGIIADNNSTLVIRGNYIGTDATGTSAAGNGDWGIWIRSDNNVVGGPTAADRNVISGNGQDGIWIDGSSGNVIGGNYIGTNALGTAALGNAFTGIWVNNASGNTIGGTTAADRNVISGNGFVSNWQGILLQNSKNNVIHGNYIGTNALGTAAIGNAGPGVELYGGADNNVVSGNVVSGNRLDGIVIYQSNSNAVRSNIIGANALGTGALGNGDNGVWITGSARDNMIGGPSSGDGNLITANGSRLSGSGYSLAGVEVDGSGSTGNAILGNRIYGNAGLGIDLNVVNGVGLGDGVTANDTGDGDGGPNRLQNFPTFASAVTNGTKLQVEVSLNSTANTNFRIDVFASSAPDSPSGYGEGERYLGSFNITTDNTGNVNNFRWILNASVTAGEAISATATVDLGSGTFGGTSEFSRTVAAANNAPPVANDAIASGLEDTLSIPITLTGTDVEGPIASFRVAALPVNGTLYTDVALTTPAVAGTDYAASGNALTLYFKPAANWNGTTGFQFTTTDLLGTLAVAPASAIINVTSVNDAPVLMGAINLDAIDEDPASNPGTLVSALIAGEVGDSDIGALKGIAVTAVDNTNGAWEFSTDGGSSWNAFGSPSAAAARLLAADGNTFVRFVPNPNWNGTVTNGITFHAWDQTSGTAGGTAVLSPTKTVLDNFGSVSYDNNNGTASWATSWVETDSAGGGAGSGEIRVEAGSLRLHPAVNGDSIYREINLTGASIATLTFDYTNSLGAIDRVDLQVSSDGGGSYSTLATFSSTSNTGSGAMSFDISAYIAANTRVRFVVAANGGNQYLYVDNVQIAYVTQPTGGSTAFSAASASSGITVSPINDAPVATNLSAPETYAEDTLLNLTDIVVSDVDSATVTVILTLSDAAAGALNTATAGSVTSTFAGGVWSASGAIANVNTLLAGLTFSPALNYNSNFTISTSVSDGIAPALTGSKAMTGIPVNDAPVATNLSAPETYTEDTPLNLTDIVVSDVDSATVTVILTLSDVAAGALNTATAGSVTSTFAGGVWSASGAIANVNTLLAGLTFTPALNYNSNFTISTSVSDGIAPALTGSKAMTGVPQNDAPSVTTSVGSIVYTENDPATPVDPVVVVSDVDNTSLASAMVRISSGYVNGEDALSFITAGGITGVWNGATGILTLTGPGTLAEWQTVLRSVAYENTSDAPTTGMRTIELVVNDGTVDSLPATRTVDVSAVNDYPTATIVPATYSATEQIALTLAGTGLSVADIEAEAASASVTVRLTATSGTVWATPGTTGVGVAGSGGSIVTLTGTIAEINDLLAGNNGATVEYLMTSDSPPATDTLTLSINDGGWTGAGGPLVASDFATVALTGVNDPPVNTVPGSATTAEDTVLVFSASGSYPISITDVDAGAADVEVTLSVTNGLLTLSGITGLAFTSGDGTDDAVMRFTGTVAAINAALDGLTFDPDPDFNGAAILTLSTDDLGNSGSGGALTDLDDKTTITVTPQNDAPDGTDTTIATTRDVPHTFAVTDFGFTDADAGDAISAVRIETISPLPAGATLQRFGIDVNAGDLILASDITTGNFVFTPAAGDTGNGYASFTFSVQDTGGPAFDTTPNTMTLDVLPPVNTPPDATDITITAFDNASYVFTVANFGFTDADAGDAMSAVRIDTQTLPVGATLRLSGTDVTDGQLISVGDIVAGNLIFTPALLATGSPYASFTFSVQDTDGPAFDATPNTMTINVVLATAAPVNTVPGPRTVNEDATLAITGISVSDANGDLTTIELTVSSGTLNAAAVGGTTLTGNGSGALTIALGTGTQTDLNAALTTLTYRGLPDYAGPDSLTITSTDALGLQSVDTVAITVSPVNDAPTATIVPLSYAATEQDPLTLAGTGLSVGDIDAGAANVTATLAVVSGTLTVNAGTTGVSLAGSGTSVVTLTGSIAQINDVLAGNNGATATYVIGSESPPATDTLTLSINDGGATGSGGALGAADSATIGISAVNDPPVNTIPGSAVIAEDVALVFSSGTGNQISVTDVDAAGAALEVTLSATNGVLSLAGIGGLTFTAGTGTGDASVTFTGTLTAINNALNGMSFLASQDYNGLAFLTLSTSDRGASGSGPIGIDNDSTTITVTPVNDAPGGTDATVTAFEDLPYAFTSVDFGYTDVDFGDTMSAIRIDTISLPAGATLVGPAGNVKPGDVILVSDIDAGKLVFASAPDVNGAGYASFTFSVRDTGVPPGPLFDQAPNTMTIDVAPVNDLPFITSDGGGAAAALSIAENTTAVTTVTAGDIDLPPQTLTYSIAGGLDAGRFTINATTGALGFATAPNFEAPGDAGADNVYEVTVRVSDGMGGSDTQALSITVIDVNDAPVAIDDGYATTEDVALSVTAAGVLANDVDEDGNLLSSALVSGPANGTLSFNADGSFVYVPSFNFTGVDSFTYRVSDATLQSGVATVTITVNPDNLAPTSADGSVNTDEGVSYAFTLADFNYSDPDGDPLDHIEITSLPVDGTLLLNGSAVAVNDIVTAADIAAGMLTYAPPASVPGPVAEQFGFRVHDGTQYQAGSQLMTVAVAPLPVVAPPPPSGGGGGSTPPPSTGGSDDSGSGGSGDSGSSSGSAGQAPPAGGGRSGTGGGESAAPATEAPAQEIAKVESTESAAALSAPSVAESGMTVRAGGVNASSDGGGLGTPIVADASKHEKEAEEAAVVAALSAPEFQDDLNKLRQENQEEATGETRVAGTVFAASTSLSVGYVIWLLRGGVLLSSLLSSLPAWRLVDPLPVLSRLSDDSDDEDDASLEELVTHEGEDEHGDDDYRDDDAIEDEGVGMSNARGR